MSSDEIVWQVINQQFCAFKLKTTKDRTFCRNEYNVTGLCSRQACPLANSRYATVRSNPETGTLYLCMKTVERAHLPSKLWERVRLSTNYARALEQIDEHLKYWPKFLVHKCKQRLTRLTQVAIRTKRLMKEEERLGEHVVQKLAPKIRRREETRERRAEAAAKVERVIERELIERLRSGAYGDRPLNVEEEIWKKVLRGLERVGEGERDVDLDEGIENEKDLNVEEELEGDGDVEYVSDIDGYSEDEDLDDMEDWLGANSDNDESDGSEDDEFEDDDEDENSSQQSEADDQSGLAQLKQNISGLKRKLSEQGLRKTAAKKSSRGPRKEIEYEVETSQTLRNK